MSKYCQENFDGNNFQNSSACDATPAPHLDRIHQDIYGGEARPSNFVGLNLGILKFGVSDGSLDLGVDIMVARVEAKLGQETGASAGVGIEGLASAGAGAGVAIDGTGLHAGTGAGVDAANLVDGSGRVGADLGTTTGVNGSVGAEVGPTYAGVRASAGVGQDGLNAGAGGRVGIIDVVGAHAGGQVSLSGDSSASVGAGGYVGPYEGGTTGGVYTDGDRDLRPGINGYARTDVYQSGGLQDTYAMTHGRQAQVLPASDAPAPAPAPAPVQSNFTQQNDVPPPVQSEALPPVQSEALPPIQNDAPQVNQNSAEPVQFNPSQSPVEAAAPPPPLENFATVSSQARQQVMDQSVIVAKPGQTYLDILQEANPGVAREDLSSQVPFIEQINDNKPLSAGDRVATLSAQEIDWQTRVLTAQRMGWPAPQG